MSFDETSVPCSRYEKRDPRSWRKQSLWSPHTCCLGCSDPRQQMLSFVPSLHARGRCLHVLSPHSPDLWAHSSCLGPYYTKQSPGAEGTLRSKEAISCKGERFDHLQRGTIRCVCQVKVGYWSAESLRVPVPRQQHVTRSPESKVNTRSQTWPMLGRSILVYFCVASLWSLLQAPNSSVSISHVCPNQGFGSHRL